MGDPMTAEEAEDIFARLMGVDDGRIANRAVKDTLEKIRAGRAAADDIAQWQLTQNDLSSWHPCFPLGTFTVITSPMTISPDNIVLDGPEQDAWWSS
jgi:hypothetical protein